MFTVTHSHKNITTYWTLQQDPSSVDLMSVAVTTAQSVTEPCGYLHCSQFSQIQPTKINI